MTGPQRARLAVTVTFLTHAAVFATWAPRIPAIKGSLGLTHDDLGIALGVMAVGLFVGTRFTGRMEREARTATPIRIFMPAQCLALAGPAYATNLFTLCLALFFLGMLGGLIDVAMNAHAVAVERLYQRPIMSGFHGLWSCGMMGASAVAALVAGIGIGVHGHFVAAGILLALGSAPVLRWLLAADEEGATRPGHGVPGGVGNADETGNANGTGERESAKVTGSVFVVTVLALVAFGSFLAEGAITDWGPVFLHDDRGATESLAALAVTVFTGAMAVSRLAGDWFRARLGSVRLARFGAAIAFAGLALALLVQPPALVLAGLAIAGLGVGPLVPIVFSSAGNTATSRRSSVLGIAVAGGYLGGILGPVLIGFVAGRVGLVWALSVPLLFLLATWFAARLFVEPVHDSGARERVET